MTAVARPQLDVCDPLDWPLVPAVVALAAVAVRRWRIGRWREAQWVAETLPAARPGAAVRIGTGSLRAMIEIVDTMPDRPRRAGDVRITVED